jgi:hypothetical protein
MTTTTDATEKALGKTRIEALERLLDARRA